MAPRGKKDEEDIIPCNTPAELTWQINEMQLLFAQPETEHNWEKFAKSLSRLAAMTRGGAAKLDTYLAAVGPTSQGGVGDKVVACMLTERAALSKHALDLLTSLAPRLAERFTPLLQRLYIPPLLDLVRRTNNLVRERAEATLFIILKSCPHAAALIVFLSSSIKDPNAKFRKAIARGVRILVEKWQAGGKVEEVEKVVKGLVSDKDVDVRKVAKELWVAYQLVWPNRVDQFAAPLSPTTRKRLEIKASDKACASSSSSTQGSVRVKSAPKPTSAPNMFPSQPTTMPSYPDQQHGLQHTGPSRPGLASSTSSMSSIRSTGASRPNNPSSSSYTLSRSTQEQDHHPSYLSTHRTESHHHPGSAPAYITSFASSSSSYPYPSSDTHDQQFSSKARDPSASHPASSSASSTSSSSSLPAHNFPAPRTTVSRTAGPPAPLLTNRSASSSLLSEGPVRVPNLRSFSASIPGGGPSTLSSVSLTARSGGPVRPTSTMGPPSRPVRPPGAPPPPPNPSRRPLTTLGRSTGRYKVEPTVSAAAAVPLPSSPPSAGPHIIPLPPSPSPSQSVPLPLPLTFDPPVLDSIGGLLDGGGSVGPVDLMSFLDEEQNGEGMALLALDSKGDEVVNLGASNGVREEEESGIQVGLRLEERMEVEEKIGVEDEPLEENKGLLLSEMMETSDRPEETVLVHSEDKEIEPTESAWEDLLTPPTVPPDVDPPSSAVAPTPAPPTVSVTKANKEPGKPIKPSAPRVQLSAPASRAFKPVSRQLLPSAAVAKANKPDVAPTRRAAVKPSLPTLSRGPTPTSTSTRSVSGSSASATKATTTTPIPTAPSSTTFPKPAPSSGRAVSQPAPAGAVGARPRAIKKPPVPPAPVSSVQPRKERMKLKPALPSFKPTKKPTTAAANKPPPAEAAIPLPPSPVLRPVPSSTPPPPLIAELMATAPEQLIPLPLSPPNNPTGLLIDPQSSSPAPHYPTHDFLMDTDLRPSSAMSSVGSERSAVDDGPGMDHEPIGLESRSESWKDVQLISFDSPLKGGEPTPRKTFQGISSLGQRSPLSEFL